MNKTDLIKLGLGGLFSSSEDVQIVDNNPITHKKLQNLKLDIINKGTLRKPVPILVIKEPIPINTQEDYNTYKVHQIPIEMSEYYSEFRFKYPMLGQFNYFYIKNSYLDFESIPFLNGFVDHSIKKSNDDYIIGIDNSIPYVRHAFNLGYTNTTVITGKSYSNKYESKRKQNTVGATSSNLISGAAYRQSFAFKKWTAQNTTGIVSGNFSNYYLTFPNTVDSWSYYKIPIATKIAAQNTNIEAFQKLNGIILISTGDGTNSKICYISPHGMSSGERNSLVYNVRRTTGLYGNIIYQKSASGIIANSLVLGSQYYSGNVFPKTGIRTRLSSEYSLTDYYSAVTGLSGEYNDLIIDRDQHLLQSTPIKDTLYYKFYSGLYTGNKTFNTGTWSGIIPANTLFSIELITNESNKDIGMYFPLNIIYSGFGTNDSNDVKITKYLSNKSFDASGLISFGSGQKQYISGDADSKLHLNIVGRGYGDTLYNSFLESQRNSRNIINQKIKKLSSINLSGIAFTETRALRKLNKFKAKG